MSETSGPEAHQERVASLEARVEELLRTVAVLTTEVAELKQRGVAKTVRPVRPQAPAPAVTLGASPQPPVAAADGTVVVDPAGIGRRRMLLGSGAAAAAATAALLATSATPAAAANGDSLIMGVDSNTSTAPTVLNPTTTTDVYGLWVSQQGAGGGLLGWTFEGDSVYGYAGSGRGVVGQSDTGDAVVGLAGPGTGVVGFSDSGPGVSGVSGADVGVSGDGPVGVRATSSKVNLRLVSPGGRTAPTSDATAHLKGDVVTDGSGNLWTCVVSGTPGTWRKVAGPASAGTFHLLPSAVRIYDSRPGTAPSDGPKTPLTGNTARLLSVAANNSGIPAGATAISATLLLLNASSAGGNFTIWAGGAARPSANAMVWGGTAGRFASTAITRISADRKVNVAASASADLALDVVGYYL